MLLAHLPAGYLMARRLAPRLAREPRRARRLMALCLVASVLPDVDLIHFYLIDGRQTLHHDYWTHIPAFWLVAAAAAASLFRIARTPVPWAAMAALLTGVFLHLALDTVAGGIAWLYPYDIGRIALVAVPARFDWWIWNFVLHWSFVLEIAILAWAAREIGLARKLRALKAGRAGRMFARPGRRESRFGDLE